MYTITAQEWRDLYLTNRNPDVAYSWAENGDAFAVWRMEGSPTAIYRYRGPFVRGEDGSYLALRAERLFSSR